MLPTITLQPKQGKRVRDGHPWVYSNELVMDAAAKALPPGSLVRVVDRNGIFVAIAHFNPHTLIAARVLAREECAVDAAFWQQRLRRALDLRDGLFDAPYYRMVHAEADGLPGLVIDRFGAALVVQANTAGMNASLDALVDALDAVVKPKTIILRGDTPARALEGLLEDVRVLKGENRATLEALENGLTYKADGMGGQKTGWFYDQRRNRALVAGLARGKTMLDLYTHTGGFGLLAARHAREVLCIDRSEDSLVLAAMSAAANRLTNIAFAKEDVFEFCAKHKDRRFDVVVADPPAFAKSKKDVGPASRGYRKLARMAAGLVAPGGFLFMASCSHAITRERFDEEVVAGVGETGRTCLILARTGADLDHPTHPHLPESSYLKGILLNVN